METIGKDPIPLRELKRLYYPAKDVGLVEETDEKRARSSFVSLCSCCWGNKVIVDTGWAEICAPSKVHKSDVRTVFVCKVALLGDLSKKQG